MKSYKHFKVNGTFRGEKVTDVRAYFEVIGSIVVLTTENGNKAKMLLAEAPDWVRDVVLERNAGAA